MKAKFKILFFLLLIGSQTLIGQTIKIIGTVTGEQGEPMPGVSVVLVGTYLGTSTDSEGKFSLNAAPGNQLRFSFIGYQDQIITIGNESVIYVRMAVANTLLEEVVIVGYSTQVKKSVVGAIAQTSGEALKSKGTVGNLTDALSGIIPGVTVMTKTGLPGTTGEHGNETDILIRGLSTWNNSQPLILVDGVQRPMSDVSVDEIENFTVLKDASATAVFGVKGANGVILITTKRGQTGKAKVSFEVNTSVKSISKMEKPLESYDGLVARNWAVIHEFPLMDAAKMDKYTSPRILGYYRDNVDPEKYTNVDWQDVMIRDHTVSSKYSVNVSGGTEFVKYFSTLSYIDEGDIMNTGTGDNPRGYKNEFKYQRINFRTNLDFLLTKTTTFKVNLSGYYGRQQAPDQFKNAFWPSLYRYAPNTPLPIYPDGTFGADDKDVLNYMGNNMYFDLLTGGTKVEKRTALTSDFDLEQKLDFITKGLSARGRISFDNYFTSEGSDTEDPSGYVLKRFDVQSNSWVYIIPLSTTNNFDFYPEPLGYTLESPASSATRRNLYYELALNYKRSFGKHSVEALALFSREQNATGSNWPSKREDWVGRVKYEYAEKYLFEMNGAYNGSERFGPQYKFEFFPSIAVGWRVSEESFIKNNIPQISNLKLRYSIGWIGSDNLGNDAPQWGYLTTWNPYNNSRGSTFQNQVQDRGPSFGNGIGGTNSIYVNQSFVEGAVGNPNIRWESKRSQNYGIEIGLFNDLITGSVDYYIDYRYDMLIPSSQRTAIPDFFGQKAPSVNAGEVSSKGLELDFRVNKTFGKVNLWGTYTWTVAKNKVLYQEDAELLPAYQKKEGYRINQVRTQMAADMITSWDELYTGVMGESSTGRKNTLTGGARLIDFNADGFINDNDATPFGYARQPQNTYSFAFGGDYKGLTLLVQFIGMYNSTISGGAYAEEMYNGFPSTFQSMADRTAMPEYGVSNPTYRAFGIDKKGAIGHWIYYDGSLFRLKTLELSYSLPQAIIKRMSIDNVRLFVNGNNLWLWNHLPQDVEGTELAGGTAGESNLKYPATKSFNFGINVTL